VPGTFQTFIIKCEPLPYENRYLDPNFTDEESIRTSGARRKRRGYDQEIKGKGGLTWAVGSWVCYSLRKVK